ncbi:MAG: glycogen debranching protein [Myxococcaceae bacterium]
MRAHILCSLLLLTALSCGPTDSVRLYASQPKAPSYKAEDIEALKVMGPTIVDRGVNFAVYSEHATRLELMLFEDPESNLPTKTYPMERFGNVWNLFVEGIGPGQHYGYRAWGPNWEYDPTWIPGSITGFNADVDGAGNRFNPNKLLFDPYSKALHRDHDWSKGNLASGPRRTDVTYAAASKSVVVKSDYQWSSDEEVYRQNRQDPNWAGHRWNEQIVYEVHLKGFTANSASGVTHPGTYKGFAEKADYFKELGITAVELMPIHEKPLDGTYWGYQTLNFFAPELSYSSRQKWNEVADEFKGMVDELHKRNIEVILDVVYNHTGEGGFWRNKIQEPSPDPRFDSAIASASNLDPKEIAGLYSYRGLDNQAYYALTPDKQNYWNDTGVGNQTRTNYTPFRKLIVDSLRYYVEEMHVDGFRFDLAPILGIKDAPDTGYGQWDTRQSVLEDIINDPVLLTYNTRLIAEPWSVNGFFLGQFPANNNVPGVGWGEWNGRFRDFWRSLINQRVYNQDKSYSINGRSWNGSGWDNDEPSLGEMMTGSQATFGGNGRNPYASVNFITVHDGFTLYDTFSYDQKRNECSPLNPICCSDPFSPFCDPNSGENNNRSRAWHANLPADDTCRNPGDNSYVPPVLTGVADDALRRQMMRNAFAAMLLSHGTPLLYGGDEWMRTQLGNNNAYPTQADNEWNWFDWGAWLPNADKERMHDFVRGLIQFRKSHSYALEPMEYGKGAAFSWKSPQNTDQVNWDGKSIMIHYYDKTKGPELAILVNMEETDVPFTLPAGRTWKRVIDTQAYFDRNIPAGLTDCEKQYLARHKDILTGHLEKNPTLDKTVSYNLESNDPVPNAPYGLPPRTIVVLEAK